MPTGRRPLHWHGTGKRGPRGRAITLMATAAGPSAIMRCDTARGCGYIYREGPGPRAATHRNDFQFCSHGKSQTILAGRHPTTLAAVAKERFIERKSTLRQAVLGLFKKMKLSFGLHREERWTSTVALPKKKSTEQAASCSNLSKGHKLSWTTAANGNALSFRPQSVRIAVVRH